MRRNNIGRAWLLVLGWLVTAGTVHSQDYAPADPQFQIPVGNTNPFTYGGYVMYRMTTPLSGTFVRTRPWDRARVPVTVPIAGEAGAGKGTILVRPEGKLRLRCATRWHHLDLTLKADRPVRVEDAGLLLLRPPELKEGTTWKVKGAALTLLARALHAVEWQCEPMHEEAYAKWQGSMPTKQSFTANGELALKLTKAKDGYRAAFTGKVQTVDEGWYGNRFGPNGWRHLWSHALRGSLVLNEEGRVLSLELEDAIRVKGKFSSGTLEDPFTQEGTLKVTIAPPEPLAAGEEEKAKGLIEMLGSEDFATREEASAALAKMGPKVAPLLRAWGLTSKDPEIRRRSEALLRRLP